MITFSSSLKEALSLAPPCECKACSHGCTVGSGFLAEGDVQKIADFLKISIEQLKKTHLEESFLFNRAHLRPKLMREGKPYGPCTFFQQGKCSIHPVKPLQCRIATGCKPHGEELQQWFMLHHLIDRKDPESLRQYAQYLKSGGKTLPGGTLEEIIPDKKQLQKILSYDFLR